VESKGRLEFGEQSCFFPEVKVFQTTPKSKSKDYNFARCWRQEGWRMQQQWWIPHHSMFLINFVAAATNTEPEMEGKADAAAQIARLSRRLITRPHPFLSYFLSLPRRIQPAHTPHKGVPNGWRFGRRFDFSNR